MEMRVGTGEKANILIVDDITSNLVILTEMIKSAGHVARPVTSAKQALAAIEVQMPNLILLDISMPDMDGYEFCELLKKDVKTRDIPIIFISAMNSKEDKIKGFKLGAIDFVSKPFELEEVTLRINTHLKLYKMQHELEVYNKRLYKMVGDQIKKIAEEERHFIYALAKLSEIREHPDGQHLENVSKNCKLIAMSLQFSSRFESEVTNSFVDAIEIAATLHDIGKIAVSDTILLKPGKLTEEEMNEVRKHTEIGAKMLEEMYEVNEHNDFLGIAIDIAHYHHEKWDGTGYPKGLKGTEIPLAARIMAIVDVYDALVSDRCYKDSYSHERSMEIINEEAGRSFDPDIVAVFNKVQKQLRHG
ncbi:MAG: response regulator [Lachnospiraceae bacterium]|nr:response regulator [Lachnospiraceae bacterium]